MIYRSRSFTVVEQLKKEKKEKRRKREEEPEKQMFKKTSYKLSLIHCQYLTMICSKCYYSRYTNIGKTTKVTDEEIYFIYKRKHQNRK